MGAGRGPAEEPREIVARGCCALGVPGPSEAWRRVDEVGGLGGCGFNRRRLFGSFDGERGGRRGFRSDDWEALVGLPLVTRLERTGELVTIGAVVLSGEGFR